MLMTRMTFGPFVAAAVVSAICLAGCSSTPAPDATVVPGQSGAQTTAVTSVPPPTRWPRTFTNNGNTLEVFQPQVDQWTDHSTLACRAAVAVTAAGTTEQHYGVAAIRANTSVDDATRTVFLTNFDVAVTFPGLPPGKADTLKALVKFCFLSVGTLDVPLD